MNRKEDRREGTMSFSLWTLACGVIPQIKGLPQTWSRQARMHPQSKGDAVLRLHSCRALGWDEGFRVVRSQAGQDALRAICDLKKPIRVLPLALGSPKRLEVVEGSGNGCLRIVCDY